MPRFFPTLTATRLQAFTYLFGIALFSIAFLVFLNSSISFVVTDVIGQKDRVGDAVGTLGFADELLALLACPVWGLLSDRIGVRTVAVLGYCIIGISLVCLVQSTNVYPELLVGRLAFSVGAAACSTMVTAVLPAMVFQSSKITQSNNVYQALVQHHSRNGSVDHIGSISINSEATITPTRYSSRSGSHDEDGLHEQEPATTSQLAGFVGLFTGAGALVALAVFLPLPVYFQKHGETPASSVKDSFYVVGSIAGCVAAFIFFGLRRLPGEEHKSYRAMFTVSNKHVAHVAQQERPHSYLQLLTTSLKLGFTDPSIGIGYLGGFVARASSVGISLFIPLFVNAYFVRNGLCMSNPDDLTDIRENCQRAYKLAAALTGIAETAALLGAPLFGYVGARVSKNGFQWPLMLASVVGIFGYVGLAMISNPDAFHGEGGSRWAFLAVVLIGISQIGSIVCSLALLSAGVGERKGTLSSAQRADSEVGPIDGGETAALLPSVGDSAQGQQSRDRSNLKGSIAGVYSLAGGAGILLLTKLGGALFDSWTPVAPFYLMASFNAILLVAIIAVGAFSAARRRVRT